MAAQVCYPRTLGVEVGWRLQVCSTAGSRLARLQKRKRKRGINSGVVSKVVEGPVWKNRREKGLLYKEGAAAFCGLQFLSMYLTSCWMLEVAFLLSEAWRSIPVDWSGRITWACEFKTNLDKTHLKTWFSFSLLWLMCCWTNALCWTAHYCCLWVEAEPLGLLELLPESDGLLFPLPFHFLLGCLISRFCPEPGFQSFTIDENQNRRLKASRS